MSRKDKSIGKGSKLVVAYVRGWRGKGSDSLTGTEFLFGVMKMF